MCSKFQASGMSHMLDDFFFIGPGDSPICLNALEKFLTICEEAGIPIKHVKTQQPSTLITIYGSTASHISAISYVHKVMNIFDPTQAFVARKILKGCQKTYIHIPPFNVCNSRASVLKNKNQTLIRLRLHLKCFPISIHLLRFFSTEFTK